MKIMKLLTVAMLLIGSTSTFAFNYFHPVTGDLVFDGESYEFLGNCVKEDGTAAVIVDFNSDGSFDLLFDDFNLDKTKENRTSKNCQFKIDLTIPSGWKVKVLTKAAVEGFYKGNTAATLRHLLAGESDDGISKIFSGIGTYSIVEDFYQVDYSACKRDVTLKTVATVYAFDEDAFISMESGATTGWTHVWKWSRC